MPPRPSPRRRFVHSFQARSDLLEGKVRPSRGNRRNHPLEMISGPLGDSPLEKKGVGPPFGHQALNRPAQLLRRPLHAAVAIERAGHIGPGTAGSQALYGGEPLASALNHALQPYRVSRGLKPPDDFRVPSAQSRIAAHSPASARRFDATLRKFRMVVANQAPVNKAVALSAQPNCRPLLASRNAWHKMVLVHICLAST